MTVPFDPGNTDHVEKLERSARRAYDLVLGTAGIIMRMERYGIEVTTATAFDALCRCVELVEDPLLHPVSMPVGPSETTAKI